MAGTQNALCRWKATVQACRFFRVVFPGPEGPERGRRGYFELYRAISLFRSVRACSGGTDRVG